MGNFVHLHLHTEYSLLDGATRIATIADKAIECGQTAVAITDHGVMFGAVEFYHALKDKGLKPIIGCEVYVARRGRLIKESKIDISGNHLILLVKDKIGYKNLCYMVSQSYIDGFYSKPRIDMELLREHHDGLIALSGCLAGKIPQCILAGDMAEAEKYALEMKSLFGDDFYLEIQNHNIDDERRVAYGIKLLSEKLNIPMVATNDVHYLEKSDAEIQEILLCIQTGNTLEEGKPFGFQTDEFYFKSTEEMEKLFSSFDGAIENTVKIADKCNFDFEFDKLHLPNFVPENGLDHKTKLYNDTYKGFLAHIKAGRFDFDKNPRSVYEERLEYELKIIDSMGFNAYFLIVSDFVAYAKRNDIPVGPGRGSGAGSLVAFCIGITDVDPIAFDLLFERFLNPERVSMPDFDIDFCYIRRGEVIEYVKRKYGEDKVAQIATFGTLAPRVAVRDVGKVLGMPYSTADAIAKLVPREATSIDEALKNKDLMSQYVSDSGIKKLIDLSRKIEGVPRNASTHAAGVIMTEKPIYEYVPLYYGGTGIATQFDMTTDASLGLVKFDFLGLRYITVIHDAEQLIKEKNPDFSISKVPFDDEKTFKMLREGKTDGVFQLESGGMKAVLTRLCPTSLEDIIACVALFRPGPMDSIDTFIARKHGKEKTVYKVPELKDILDVTYGCIVYQEQVMQICRKLAGYSYARADIVRRAMSKKKTSAMQAEREDFINGCENHGVSREIASSIFEEMVSFAKYAFNKSHATAYGITSYRTAYLKANYPCEYFSALMSSVLHGVGDLKLYIADAQKFSVKVLPPDINKSKGDFTVSDGNIRFGLLGIKNVGTNFADYVVKARQNGEFSSFDNFVERMADFELNKRTLESLIKCGAFDSLGVPRSSLLSCYENIISAEQEKHRSNIDGQLDLFSMVDSSSSNNKSSYEYPKMEEFPLRELMAMEKECSGMYFSGHIIDHYSKHIDSISPDSIAEIKNSFSDLEIEKKYRDKQAVTVAGIISAKKTKVTKTGKRMAFLLLEDKLSEIEVIVFANQYEKFEKLLSEENAVSIIGNIAVEDNEDAKIILTYCSPLSSNSEMTQVPQKSTDTKSNLNNQKQSRLYVKVTNLTDQRIEYIYRLSAFNRGDCGVVLFDESTKKYSLLKAITIDPSDKVISKLKNYFGENSVVYK